LSWPEVSTPKNPEGRPEVLRAYEALALTVAIERAPVVLRLVAHAGDAATAEFLRPRRAAHRCAGRRTSGRRRTRYGFMTISRRERALTWLFGHV